MMRYECAWAETENSGDVDIDSRFWPIAAIRRRYEMTPNVKLERTD